MRSFRKEVFALRELSTVLENNQHLSHPKIQEAYEHILREHGLDGSDVKISCNFNFWHGEKGELEKKFLEVFEAFPDVDFKLTAPTDEYSEIYYSAIGLFHGIAIKVITHRNKMCELVVVSEEQVEEEIPDPDVVKEIMKGVPLVKQTRVETKTEWQCNSAISSEIDPFIKSRKVMKNV